MCGRGVISAWKVEHESEVKIVCMLWWWRLDIFFEAKRSLLLDYYSVRNRKDRLVGGKKARGKKIFQEIYVLSRQSRDPCLRDFRGRISRTFWPAGEIQ